MKNLTIQIKNMICLRCIYAVKQILTELEIEYKEVGLGYAELEASQKIDLEVINKKLEELDLGLIEDQNKVLVHKINNAVYDYLEQICDVGSKTKLSQYLSQQLARNYYQLSKIYSLHQGETIEQHFIELRTNKVKELIRQGKLNLSQIAIIVGYSSIHYLSGQFKKYTGQSLSQFKKEWEASFSSNGRDSVLQETGVVVNERSGCTCNCKDCSCNLGCSLEVADPSRTRGMHASRVLNGNSIGGRTTPNIYHRFGEYRLHASA